MGSLLDIRYICDITGSITGFIKEFISRNIVGTITGSNVTVTLKYGKGGSAFSRYVAVESHLEAI